MRPSSRLPVCALFVAVCLITAATVVPEAAAQEMVKLSLEELAGKSEFIVEGQVSDMRSEWNPEGTRIETHVTIRIEQYLKGESIERTITITHLGGEVGEVGEVYSGAARFQKDEEVLLFVHRGNEGRLRLTGASQGKYSIGRDQASGERMVAMNKPLQQFKAEIERIVKQ
jgi:hypothetical protein